MKRYLVYLTIAAVIGLLTFPAMAGKGGGRLTGVITVADTSHGGTTTAAVNPGGEDVYVFVQCYAPTFGGEFVYAKYFDLTGTTAELGPLTSRQWLEGPGSCTAQEGYFMRNGFGKWVVVAETTFQVRA